MKSDRYRERGVSARKEDVHTAVAQADPGLYPGAFCKIVPDHLVGAESHCLAMHADGAGTKSGLAYLWYKETGQAGVFRGIAQDALVMNVDDLLCVGALGPFLVSNTIGRNARLVPGEVIAELVAGFEEQAAAFSVWGMELVLTGGETADVGDLVRTIIVDSTVTVRLRREEVIDNRGVKPGDIIIGLASDGQAGHERTHNSGMGSNGLTSARHDLLKADYGRRYPETFESGMPDNLRYGGPHALDDALPGTPLSIGEALLSPTRTYAPLMKSLLEDHRDKISALVHCTGGGQSKILRAGNGIHYVKDNLFPAPPLFKAIQEAGGATWREMYQVFNMGHRMEVIGDAALLPVLQELGKTHGIAVKQVGHCEDSGVAGKNRVTVHTPGGPESYLPE